MIKQLEQMKFIGHPSDQGSSLPIVMPQNSVPVVRGKFDRRYDALVVNVVTEGLPFHNNT